MKRYAVYLCPLPDPPLVVEGDCPNRDQHTPAPTGYLEWHEWAQQMSRTHRSSRCPVCKLWSIWVPKTPRKGTS